MPAMHDVWAGLRRKNVQMMSGDDENRRLGPWQSEAQQESEDAHCIMEAMAGAVAVAKSSATALEEDGEHAEGGTCAGRSGEHEKGDKLKEALEWLQKSIELSDAL